MPKVEIHLTGFVRDASLKARRAKSQLVWAKYRCTGYPRNWHVPHMWNLEIWGLFLGDPLLSEAEVSRNSHVVVVVALDIKLNLKG